VQQELSRSDVRRSRRIAIQSIVALSVASLCWAFSSPPRSTPDEILHIANIWCAEESDGGACISKEVKSNEEIFGTFGYSPDSCFWRQPAIPASCSSAGNEGTFLLLQEGSYYESGFQRVMHRFVGSNGPLSVLRMKMFNALLFAAIAAYLMLFAPTKISRSWLAATAVTVAPLSIWLITSINPSGWGIIGLGALWPYTIWFIGQRFDKGYLVEGTSIRLVTPLLLALLIFLATQARSDVKLFAVVALATLAAFEVAYRKIRIRSQRAKRFTLVGLITFATMLVLLALTRGFLGYRFRTELTPLNPDGPSVRVWFTNWLTYFPAVFLDAYGKSGLGENEIAIPELAAISSVLVLGGVILFASIRGSLMQLTSAVFLGLAFVSILWFASIELDLYNVPGRYVMPLFPVIVGTYIYYSQSALQLFDILRLRQIAIGLLGVANALGLYAVVERYSAGSSAGLRVIPVRFDEWWWDFLPIGPNAVVILGSVSWVVFLVYAFRFLDERKLREAAS